MEDFLKNPLTFFTHITGFAPYIYQAEFLNMKEKRIALRSGRQIGKCLAKDEYIYTPLGIKGASEVKDGDFILGGKVSGLHNFEDEIYKITFANGTSIKVNGEHPFWAMKSYKGSKVFNPRWLSAEEIYNSKNIRVFFNDNENFDLSSCLIGWDFARLLGYLLSDGYWGENQTLKFTNNNEKFIKDVEGLAVRLGYILSKRKKNNGYDVYLKTFTSSGKNTIGGIPQKCWWREEFKNLGIYDKSSFGKLQSLPDSEMKEFIKGYFNGDGYLWIKKRKKRISRIEIGFCIGTGRRKAYEFQYMLWRLGIHSIVKKELMKKSKNPFYRVLIAQRTEVKKILKWLEDTKHPEKFKLAKGFINNETPKFKRFLETPVGRWIKVSKIERVGKDYVYGWETDTHEIISYLGMRTHNTVVAAVRALYQAYNHPNQVILIIAPTLRQAGILIRNIKMYVSNNIDIFVFEEPKEGRKKQLPKNTATEMWFENGSQIYCLPSGKQAGDNIRGFSPHLIIVDEAAFVSEDAFSAIEPSLASTNGDLILISTPYGQRGFFYDAFRPDGEYKTMHIKSEECPNITKEFLDKRRNDPRITENEYVREYEGEFTSAADNMFRREDLKICMVIEHQTNLPEEDHVYELGVDVSRFGEDETVFTIADITDNKVIFIDFSGKEKITQTQERIEKLHAIWNFRMINVDATSFGGGIVDSLGDKGYPVYGFPFHRIREKANLYENLQRLIQDHKIQILKHKKLWAQMTDLVYNETGQGRSIHPSSKKRHDDFTDSLALACINVQPEGIEEETLKWRSD